MYPMEDVGNEAEISHIEKLKEEQNLFIDFKSELVFGRQIEIDKLKDCSSKHFEEDYLNNHLGKDKDKIYEGLYLFYEKIFHPINFSLYF